MSRTRPSGSARALCLAVMLAASSVASCGEVPLHGVVSNEPHPAAPLMVNMSSGVPYVLASDTGKFVLIYFGYTQCPDYCPMMLTDWRRVKLDLGALASGVRFVFVSVDPDRDTPAGTESYVRGFDSTFVGLAPRQPELDAIKAAWSVVSYKEVSKSPGRSANQYGVAHPAQAFLVNRAGRLLAMYPPETRWQDVAADLRKLY